MEATLMSSWDGVSGVIGANVFTGFTRAVGFLHMASGGDGWLNKDVMSVGPQLLVCLPMGAVVWCTAGASCLTGLTGVGCLTSVACWSSSSVEGLGSDVSMLGCALSMLISCWVLWYCGVCWLSWVVYSGGVSWFLCIGGPVLEVKNWWISSLGLPLGRTKQCSLYNDRYWMAICFTEMLVLW